MLLIEGVNINEAHIIYFVIISFYNEPITFIFDFLNFILNMDCIRSIRIKINFSDIFKFELKPIDNVTEIHFINSVYESCGHANKINSAI